MSPTADPKQARSRRTLERIVTAGLALLEEGGPEAVTVQAVVKKARSSVGSFYARFRGKEDLLEHLRERVRASAEAEWSETIDAESWEQSLEGGVARAVDLLLEARISAVDRLVAAAEDDEPMRMALSELAGRLLDRREEITHPDPERAVRIALAAVLGVAQHTPKGEAPETESEVLRAECVQLLLGYLASRPRDEAETVDFFDVWG